MSTPRPGPLALLVERLNNHMSNESVLERVQRMRDEALGGKTSRNALFRLTSIGKSRLTTFQARARCPIQPASMFQLTMGLVTGYDLLRAALLPSFVSSMHMADGKRLQLLSCLHDTSGLR